MNQPVPTPTLESIWSAVPQRRIMGGRKEGDRIILTVQIKGDAMGEVSFVDDVVQQSP